MYFKSEALFQAESERCRGRGVHHCFRQRGLSAAARSVDLMDMKKKERRQG